MGFNVASELHEFQYGEWRACIDCKEIKDANRCEWIGLDNYICTDCREATRRKYRFSDDECEEE